MHDVSGMPAGTRGRHISRRSDVIYAILLLPPPSPLLSTLYLHHPTMTPVLKTPQRKTERREHDTVRKSRFFEAWDNREELESIRLICRSTNIPEPTGRRWLR